MYLEFLKGERELPCTAWGNPTYNVKGWKGPCYLITDGHYKTFEELMTADALGKLRPRATTRAASTAWCTAASSLPPRLGINAGLADNLKMLAWTLR